jgi:hypothetical protein
MPTRASQVKLRACGQTTRSARNRALNGPSKSTFACFLGFEIVFILRSQPRVMTVPDGARAAAEMKRVVKPRGTVGAYVWDNLGGGFVQRPLVEALVEMGVDAPAGSGLKNTRIGELQTMFERTGFDPIETRTIEIEVSYWDFDDYWNAQTGFTNLVVQPIRKMAAPDVARLKAGLRDRLTTDRSGRIAYPARANAVKGRAPG